MFVLANGAFKSGSTWLTQIVRQIMRFQCLPKSFQHPKHPGVINSRLLVRFLDQCDFGSHHYLAKSHIYDCRVRDVLLSHTDIRVLNIKRDLRDVLVSHYFQLKRQGKISGSFLDYYWHLGRLKACQMLDYHEVWSVPSPRLHTASFERLKTEFDREVDRLGEFLGVRLSAPEIERIRRETSLQRLQERRGEVNKPEAERFFRKGSAGEWKHYMDEDMLKDLERVRRKGLGIGDAIKYKFIFDYRLRLRSFFLGRSSTVSGFLQRW